jgi:aspartate ammonia-lyase
MLCFWSALLRAPVVRTIVLAIDEPLILRNAVWSLRVLEKGIGVLVKKYIQNLKYTREKFTAYLISNGTFQLNPSK